MPDSGTGERVTPVFDFPARDGLAVQAVRVDYAPGGFSEPHRHPPGAYVYVIDGSVVFGVDDGEPVVLKAGATFYEPPGALHSVSRNASDEQPASLIAFFVLGDGESVTVLARRGGEMRVVRLRAAGGPEQLAVEEADRPRPGPGEALVAVHAAAITRDELEWPVDRLPAIPCYELCGVIEEGGVPTSALFALTPFDRDGVAADYVAVPAELLVPAPRTLTAAECAAMPLPALTAWQALFDHGRLAAGERVLIHGASGVVGGLAVQLARAHGAHVIGTASAANLGSVRPLGAHEAVDAASFEDAVEPVDLVLDTVGGERLRRSSAVLRAGGRLISVVEELPDGGVFFIVEPNREQLSSIARLADAGELKPPPVEVLPLASARDAFARSLEHGPPHKVVLDVARAS